jgi:anthranilate synthase component I
VSGDALTILQPLQLEAPFDLLELHRHNPRRYPHLLQTVSRADGAPAWDILFAFPGTTLRLDADGARFMSAPPVRCEHPAGFLETFDHWWRSERTGEVARHDAPFSGGWFVYLGYELCAEIEPTLRGRVKLPAGIPSALATRFRTAVLYDCQGRNYYCVAEPGCENLAAQIQSDLKSVATERRAPPVAAMQAGPVREEPPQRYLDGIARIKRYIRDGDVFQANLSREWWLDGWADPAALYAALRRRNPAPFAGLAAFDEFAVLSSSPERLLSARSGIAETRPIAGTRPRSPEAAEDAAYSRELIAHPKERAEHIMLIDLERNDLGRICKPGSIHVSELMALESYAHVHHIVSNIRGTLHDGVTPGAAIAAVFPGGTITGCPKVRCMEILAELEEGARGPYTGSIGYVNRNGDLDLNILIRTILVGKNRVSLRAGAGIVADSDPLRELEETRAKAKGMLNALELRDAGLAGTAAGHG